MTASAESRHTLALQHLWNARRAARLCRERETDLLFLKYHNIDYQLRGLAMAAVMSSVAFLESLINEKFLDAVEEASMPPDRLAGLSTKAVGGMRDQWTANPSVEGEKIFVKYKTALSCVGKTMDLGREPGQSVKILIQLRNALTHYKLEWQGDTSMLYEQLRKRLPVNRQLPAGPFYPNQALSADCAAWAWHRSVEFVDKWWGDMGYEQSANTALDGWPDP